MLAKHADEQQTVRWRIKPLSEQKMLASLA
jgi:hypothetical protein